MFMVSCFLIILPISFSLNKFGQKKKRIGSQAPPHVFLPPAFNFFQPQNVKKNVKQFHVNPDFLVRSCPFQFWALSCTSSKCLCILICISVTGKHSFTLTKKWCDRRWQKRREKQTMSSLLSCQISVGATIILPWNIVGGGLQYRGLCWQSLHFYMQWKPWNRLGITCQVQRLLCQSVNRKVKNRLLWQCHVVC